VKAQLESCGRSFELICVDDGSTDATAELLRGLAADDPRVRVVELSRNFGKEAALAAGLGRARGEAVLLMDADLQHPPELIPRMLELWDQGYHVVSGVKEKRARESLTYRLMARVFNTLMGGAAGSSFHGASDFKLLDRQVVGRDADDRAVEQALPLQSIEGAKGHLARQIAGDPEDHHQIRGLVSVTHHACPFIDHRTPVPGHLRAGQATPATVLAWA